VAAHVLRMHQIIPPFSHMSAWCGILLNMEACYLYSKSELHFKPYQVELGGIPGHFLTKSVPCIIIIIIIIIVVIVVVVDRW
jgi:hypothetical protein